jgi:NTP pyrophosphatase (non-canonical NTP hydrolase)
MYFNDYQDHARKFAIYPREQGAAYTVLGLCSEAGEVADKVKKALRDGWSPQYLREEIKKELGDVLWYVSQVAHEFDLKLDVVATDNIEKLISRQMRNKLQGSGDVR